jgi:hypothetical protein
VSAATVSPIVIAAPAAYSGQGREEICRIDPEACARDEHVERLSQRDTRVSRPHRAAETTFTGPLAAAPAVRRSRYGYSLEQSSAGSG